MHAVTIVTNNHRRELLAGYEIPENVWTEFFGYLGEYSESNENAMSQRFFRYGDWWYDVNDGFERTSDVLQNAGFDGFQADTYFSGVAIRYILDEDKGGSPDYNVIVAARIGFLD